MQVQVQYYTIFKDQDLLFSKLTKNKGTAPDLVTKVYIDVNVCQK